MVNRGYPSEWLYQLKQKNDIVSVVSRYVRLEKKGKKFWGCCPFHNEKTPSFSVSEEEGLFYCFGCKESGDVITFVQKIEACDFSDAIKILAELAHMQIPEFTGDKEVVEKKKTKDRLLKLLDATYKHYKENLYLPEAKPAQDYIKLRGFTRRELEDFQMGFSLGWTEIIEYLRKQGFTYKEILDAGVCQTKDNKRYYDPLSGRLVFPIFNSFDECVGFSARVTGKADFAKYLNTAETQIFQKGRVVFGLNLAKRLKKEKGLASIMIVEGQIDVIAMHRAGFKNTVGILGSALTRENAHELKRLSNTIILCFDGDEAGQKATKRSIEILKEEGGFTIKIVRLPNKLDPDEILKTKGKDIMQNLVTNALPVTDYLIEDAKSNFDLTKPDQKAAFLKEAISILKKLEFMAEAEAYLPKLSQLTNVPIDVLRRDLTLKASTTKKMTFNQNQPQNKQEEVLTTRANGNIRAIKYLLSCLIHKKEVVDKRIDYKKLLPSYKNIIEKAEEGIALSSYYDNFDVDSMPILKDCLVFDFSGFEQNAKQYFAECVWILADSLLKEKQAKLNEEFKACQNLDERREIIAKLTEVAKQLREKSLEDFYG